jgi:hypothetical protein
MIESTPRNKTGKKQPVLSLLLDPEDGGDVYPKRRLSPDFTSLYPARQNYPCEIL